MTRISRITTILLAGAALPLLAGCGANEIASPGPSSVTVINSPTPTPTPGTGTGTITPAADCPAIDNQSPLIDAGTISGPTGSYRVCRLPAIFSRSSTLPKISGLVYQINGRVDVGCDSGFAAPTTGAPFASPTVGCSSANGFALNGSGQLTGDTNVTLTIASGAILYGATGPSWLAVNRGNKINATGTAAAPIIFTSSANIRGENDDSSIGQWGGVVLMGRGPVTDCRYGSVAANTCERETEGATESAVFGGRDSAYNAGTMTYVQIRYSGYILSGNTELQALTTEAIGTGTVLNHIQSHNSSDDGIEIFGGSVNIKHLVVTGADDDSLDIDTGAQAKIQYALVVQRTGQGDGLMEIDSNNNESDTPRTTVRLANFTAIQPQVSANNEGANSTNASVLLRGNSDSTWLNGLIVTPNNECLRINGSGGTPATLTARSVLMQCNATKYLGTGSLNAAQVTAIFGSGANGNNDAYTPSLASVFINGATETAAAAVDPKLVDAFFDTTSYVGAVKDANDNWHKGWTCNASYAPFDDTSNANRSCASLPTS